MLEGMRQGKVGGVGGGFKGNLGRAPRGILQYSNWKDVMRWKQGRRRRTRGMHRSGMCFIRAGTWEDTSLPQLEGMKRWA